MQHVLRVAWRVAPLGCPLLRRHCRRCNAATPFRCAMKFRTNANGRRLDAWLIYRCDACGETWNMPVLERVAIGDIPPEQLQALAGNDPALAARHAFDPARLARHGARVEADAGVAVRKSRREGCADDATTIEIALALAAPHPMRLDRLLSRELGLTRGQLRQMHDRCALRLPHAARNALRSPARDGEVVAIDLRGGAIDPDLAATIRRRAME